LRKGLKGIYGKNRSKKANPSYEEFFNHRLNIIVQKSKDVKNFERKGEDVKIIFK